MKRIAFFLILSIMFQQNVLAFDIFSDDFTTDTNHAPTDKAYYDASNHLYRLHKKQLPNAIQVAEYGNEYVVVNGNEVEIYHYNNGTNTMEVLMDIPVTNPMGIAIRQDQRSVWTYTEEGNILRYDFTGTGMVHNPNLDVIGLTNVVSISSQPFSDTLAVLRKDSSDNGIVDIYGVNDSGNFVILETLNTGITNPVSLSMIPNTLDVVVGTGTEATYFVFDGSNHMELSLLSLTGLNEAGAVVVNNKVNLIEQDNILTYELSEDSWSYNSAFSLLGMPSRPIALSSKIDAYDFAFIDESGAVHYYMNTGTEMIENPALSITGLSINGGYVTPEYYQSAVYETSRFSLVYLETEENNDPNTAIFYEVSSDGGSTWTPIISGTWTDIPEGTQLQIKAELKSLDEQGTPRLLSIRSVQGTKMDVDGLQVTDIVLPPPDQETNYPITTFPIKVNLGAEFTFQVQTQGYIDSVIAELSNGNQVVMTNQYPVTEEYNVWEGKYVPSLEEPKGDVVNVSFIARFGARKIVEDYGAFYITEDLATLENGIKLVE